MEAYSKDYLYDVVETQGELFDYISYVYPDKDTEDFIQTYMQSKTRKSIDESQAYVNTMDARTLWDYFVKTEHYVLKPGEAMTGFMPEWIGEFYAYYQWYYNVPSAELIRKVPLKFLMKAYGALHDLDLQLAIEKVGKR